MRPADLLQFFVRDPRNGALRGALSDRGNKVELHGAVGSGIPLVTAGVLCHEEELRQPRHHVFILDDKEQAAYFMNDLQAVLENIRPVLFYPRSARVPYAEEEAVENANIAMRAEVLNEINGGRDGLCIVTFPEALAEQVITRKELSDQTFTISTGESYTMDFLDEVLLAYEFEKVDFVYEPGQYSMRGGIVDIFSFSFDHPYRLEFFGDEVESIRKFDPTSQLSVAKMTRATIVPNVGNARLHEAHEPFFSFLPPESVLWMADAKRCQDGLDKAMERARSHFDRLNGEVKRTPPEELYLDGSQLDGLLEPFTVVEFGGGSTWPQRTILKYGMTAQPAFNKQFDLISSNLRANHKNGYVNVVVSGQATQLERLHDVFHDRLEEDEEPVPYKPIPMELSEGFVDKELKVLVYTDHQLFERYHRFRLKEGFRKNKEALTIKELMSLEVGDFVVHIDHGIGEFSGLHKIEVNGKMQEAIRLTYRGGDVLYVSIHSLHRISKYSSKEGTQPKINKLGTNTWAQTKQKTKGRVKQIAYDLLQLYAKRKAAPGHAYPNDGYLQHALEASFMYEDTPDQNAASEAVKEDMLKSTPMDRLVCGDVGFGKTEIAIRAAFRAACDGKQVAVLVPTTILSMQHFKSFSRRLREFPVHVEFINRFKTGKALTETLKRVEKGEVDILVGTHALVGKRVKFKDLGLLVIDEEQKFGVGVKDKLKTLKANVDTLTLTATPIPRTLQFSLMGARDLSIIRTPPPNRHPVDTVITGFNEEVIRDAIAYEISRGGQAYFVHNRVGNIQEVAGMVQRLVPDAKVGIGHGQMEGKELEDVMAKFIDGAYDVLVATTIIESGIDISNANTMLINEAHKFGLSDLHQLRGRVGRSNRKAFCYLMAPPLSALPAESRKRLQALEQFSDLGSGMQIAMRDLDIRGAGDLLGAEQSGFINDLGFDMYQRLLAEAVRELKEEQFKDLMEAEQAESGKYVEETVLETDLSLLIPDHYVSDIPERISLYRELDDLHNSGELQGFRHRLEDRFGPLPEETEELLGTIRLRWVAQWLGMEKLVLKSGKLIAAFVSDEESAYYQGPTFARVLDYLKNHAKDASMYQRNGGLRLRIDHVETVLQALAIFEDIAGMTADQAAALTSATPVQVPQDGQREGR
ncbi:MAG: transcription-repair coupling factor [Bacteroidetes bacterium]|nr:transcription-repair coupling factor [Bacteroidota bacterium]MDA0904316.1 transcription-repair coupling factor [Bacteroidota bacterium]MDA1242821.1 transcription-repair coupling factor [Bacteroidota bacterium]